MCFNTIHELKILAKISEFTVVTISFVCLSVVNNSCAQYFSTTKTLICSGHNFSKTEARGHGHIAQQFFFK